jgi:hypothetical protein
MNRLGNAVVGKMTVATPQPPRPESATPRMPQGPLGPTIPPPVPNPGGGPQQ